jgi:acyl carrier protein
MTIIADEVTLAVHAIIADILGIDADDIAGGASLIDDYGAESIDFLDVSFKLNKRFGTRLFRGDFLRVAQDQCGEETLLIDDGALTHAGVELIEARMPETTGNPLLVAGAPRSILARLYCADTWVRAVNELLEAPGVSGEEYLKSWLDRYEARR